jgi:integrase/recombinase XerD
MTIDTSLQHYDVLTDRHEQHQQLLNFATGTIKTVRGTLRQFKRYLAEARVTDLQAVSAATVNDFFAWLMVQPSIRGTPRTPGTQNRCLSALKSFFAFLAEENYLSRSPIKDLRYAREPDYLPRNVLTVQESRKIMQQPDLQTVVGYRDRTILEVLYATGIRKAELMNLTVENVNIEDGVLRINGGKGAKDRIVPLTKLACSFLDNYIKGVRPELTGQNQTDRLFLSLRHRPMGKNTPGYLVEKYAKQAHVKKHVTCHLWRHTCATHLVQNKANLRHVQEILGHRLLTTTERYLHLTIADLKAAHHKYHPREADAK